MNWWIEANRSGSVVVWALLPHPWGEEECSADARLLEGESGRTVVSKSARGLGALQDASRGPRMDGAGSVAGLRMAAGYQPAIQPINNRRYGVGQVSWIGEWFADARLLEGESGRTVVSKSARGLGALQDASRGRMVEGAGSVAGLRMAAGLETGDTAGWETCGTGLAGTDFRRQ